MKIIDRRSKSFSQKTSLLNRNSESLLIVATAILLISEEFNLSAQFFYVSCFWIAAYLPGAVNTILEIHACSNPSPLFPNIVST